AAEDHVLRWPRDVFRRRAAELINTQQNTPDWSENVELLLDDAFNGSHPVDTFRARSGGTVDSFLGAAEPATQGAVSPSRRYLIDLLQAADTFPYEIRRRP